MTTLAEELRELADELSTTFSVDAEVSPYNWSKRLTALAERAEKECAQVPDGYKVVPVELLRVIADVLDITSDWNLYEVDVDTPKEWNVRIEDSDDSEENQNEGWCSVSALADYVRSFTTIAPEPPKVTP